MPTDSQPLLSVTIPTWNRSRFLKEMVLSVTQQAARYGLEDAVEVVISDNASTDDTQSTVEDLQAHTGVRINYHRNSSNLGALRNIVQTLELSGGRYWMLYGDDDLMAEGALPKIISLLREHGDIPVFIFEQQGGRTKLSANEQPVALSITEAARQHFYYLGNAGVFAIRAQDAQSQLAKWGLKHFQTCWPQTQLAFAAMSISPLREPVLAVPLASSYSPYHLDNTVYTSWYMWETTFYSLYRAALELRPIAGDDFFKAACAHVFSLNRVLRTARDVMLYTALYDLPEDVAQTKQATRQSLRRARGRALAPLVLTWLSAIAPRPLKTLFLYGITLARHPTQAASQVQRLRKATRQQRARRLQANSGGATKPRVYTSDDL